MTAEMTRNFINIPLGSTGDESVFHFNCVFIQSDVIVNSSSIQTDIDIFTWKRFDKNKI